jgi:RNA polymerase sigma factor (sigma-70 family)
MALAGKETEGLGTPGAVFATTHWSVVLAAGQSESPLAAAALERLCRNYWYPLYAYVRRRGRSSEDAQDLTQEFFFRLLDRRWLSQVDRQKGKFRTFLLVAVNHFLANEWDRAQAAKRGGGVAHFSLDDHALEARYHLETATALSPEQLYERCWALALLAKVLQRLREEAATAGRQEQFDELKVFLTGEKPAVPYQELATQLATTEAALKMAVQRLRRRYGELIRDEIAQTVNDPQAVEDELRHLRTVLSG